MPYRNAEDKIKSDADRHARKRPHNLLYFKEYAKRPEAKARWWELHLKRKYGLTPAEFEAMEEDQNWQCGICGRESWTQKGGRLAVDHCHTTGKVRGLLCKTCNTGLGCFEDSPEFLEGAAAYLWRAQT